MTTTTVRPGLRWDHATSISSKASLGESCPQGAFVHDTLHNCDQIAVVYDKGQRPPHITVTQVAGSVHKVMADGVAVAVIASATRPNLKACDVLLVERMI